MVEQQIITEKLPTDPKYNFLIFDFHGTMTDHQLRLIRALHRSFSHVGIKLPKETFQDVLSRQAGLKTKDLICKILGNDCPQLTEVLRFYDKEMDDVYIPIPGLRRELLKLQTVGIPMSVLTNGTQKKAIEEVLKNWGLSMSVFTPSDMQMRKPEPGTIDYVIAHTFPNNPPRKDRILFIGNEMVDTQAAANSGIDTVIIARSHKPRIIQLSDPFPTYVITNPLDLPKVVFGKFPRVQSTEVSIPNTYWNH